jgi:formate-dependent phosphoribosylglycinamide formyltransferase (GAR transformylase)
MEYLSGWEGELPTSLSAGTFTPLGAFGVDALVYDGRVYLAEVNSRFQGSSVMSARIDQALNRPDIYCAHVAAFMGLSAPPSMTLQALVH